MKKEVLIIGFLAVAIAIALACSGCCSHKEWYESGQIKSEYDGMAPWSNGVGKNLPLSHINVSGVGAGL